MTTYDLHWKAIPMGTIQSYSDWPDPYLGRGVYLLVLATTGGGYVGYYVGKADDIGRRWKQHVHEWLGNPHKEYWIPKNKDAFLQDPVSELNEGALKQGLPERQETVQAMLANTWFCWVEVVCQPGHRIEDVEYVLQEALKKHAGITVDGEVGDARNRSKPTSAVMIRNHFGQDYLVDVLPRAIIWDVNKGVRCTDCG